ncbi:MAG UNVERIFIED_CONTAM: hypothetical protein LVQ98_04275 [Rickettsiaceae bacterium]
MWKYPISQNLLDPKTLVILEIQKNINDTLHNAQLEGITKLEADPEIMDALIQQLANPKPQNGIMRVASSIIISRELCQKHSLAHALASAIVNPKTQKLLLRNLEPGDYNIANSEGKTPLDVAITSLRPFEHFIKGTLDPNKLLTLIKTSPHKSNTLEVMQYLAEQYKYLDLSNPYVAAQIMQIYASMPKIEKEFKEKFSAFQSKVSFWQQTITPKFIDACSRYKAGDGEQHPLDLIPGFLLFFEPEILTPILETLKGPWLSEGMLYNILQHYIIHTNYTDSLNCRGMENRGCGISRQKIGQTNERFKDAAKSLLNLFTNKEFYNYTSHRMAVEIITGKGNHDIDAFLSRKSEADILYILQQLTSLHGDTKFLSCTSQTTWTDPTGEHTLEAGLLFYALQEGRYDIAHYLLENGINYCSNKLPLMIAIPLFSAPKLSLNAEDTANHNKKMVEFFELVMMRYPYELLATMDDASTILHACCEKPHLTFGIIKALLGQQQTFVKINAPNNSNKTPLDILLSNITDWEAIIKVFGVMIGYEPGEKLSPKVQEDIKTSATIGSILEKMRAKRKGKTPSYKSTTISR